MNTTKILYASFDVEADGPCPYNSNMVELGISFLEEESGEEIEHFYAAIKRRDDGIRGTPETVEWLKNNGVWARATDPANARDPRDVFEELAEKIEKLSHSFKIVWIAYPAAYDWQWLKWYWTRYIENPEKQKLLGYYAVCIDTAFDFYADRVMNISSFGKELLWKDLKGEHSHTHNALDDAREQGTAYVNLMKR